MTQGIDFVQEQHESAAKVDEVKRLEKIYDITKEMFTNSESIIKIIEDKSRSNVNTGAAILAFSFLIYKPNPVTFSWLSVPVIVMMILTVSIYTTHLYISTPQKAKTVRPEELETLFSGTFNPVGVIRYNFEVLQKMYAGNVSLITSKGNRLKWQQRFLGGLLISSLIYVGLSSVSSSASSTVAPSQNSSTIHPMSESDTPTPSTPSVPANTTQSSSPRPDPYTRPSPQLMDTHKSIDFSETVEIPTPPPSETKK